MRIAGKPLLKKQVGYKKWCAFQLSRRRRGPAEGSLNKMTGVRKHWWQTTAEAWRKVCKDGIE